MTNSKIIEASKAILIVRKFKILIMKENTLGNIVIVKKVNSNPIGPKSHSNLILHALSESQKPSIKLKSRNIIPLLFIDNTQIK